MLTEPSPSPFAIIRKKEKVGAAYRMRMLTGVAQDTATPEAPRVGLGRHQQRFGASRRQEPAVRYKTMRGYKSDEGMGNGVVLMQWLHSGEDQLDLGEEMAA